MKYKLIKEYPGSPKLGNIIDNLENDWIENYPEFWQEIVEKDYEILEYKTESGISCKAPFLSDSHQFYIDERCKIYSIKRISDNSIFTIGDDVLSKTCSVPNKILSIEIINNKIRLYPRNSFYNLEDILKTKQPIFQTEDAVDIFEGDNIYWVNINTFEKVNCNKYNDDLGEISIKSLLSKKYECKAIAFSTKEKAEEYILLNKPCLSLTDVASIYPGINKSHPDKPSSQSERLKTLVKSKIQQSV